MEQERVHEFVRSVQHAERLQDAEIVVQNANVEIADGLMSEIIRVTIGKSLNLILKVAPRNDDQLMRFRDLLYTSEIHFYTEIMPELNRLQRTYIGEECNFIPRHFKSIADSGKQLLLIEDVTARGYRMLDRRLPLSDAHTTLCLQKIAEFHAISFAMQKHRPQTWRKLENGINPTDIFQGEILDWFTDALDKAIILSYDMKKPRVAEKLTRARNGIKPLLARLLAPSQNHPNVFVHLDIWCNNLMFKHDARQQPTDVVLLDFQQIAKGSPALDVSSFLYINASTNAITHWKHFARIYYDTLIEHGMRLDCDIANCYSWQMFMDDWKEYSQYGMLKSVMGISINTRDADETKAAIASGNYFYVKTLQRNSAERIWHFIAHMDDEDFL